MFDGLLFLRQSVSPLHQNLEQYGVFARIIQPSVSIIDYQKLLCVMFQFYSIIRLELASAAMDQSYLNLYSARLEALACDLTTLGYPLPSTGSVRTKPAFISLSDDYLLGVLYATEGTVLGGQVIIRHCQKALGNQIEFARQYFTGLITLPDTHWRETLLYIQKMLPNEKSAGKAAQGATAVFACLEALATDNDSANF